MRGSPQPPPSRKKRSGRRWAAISMLARDRLRSRTPDVRVSETVRLGAIVLERRQLPPPKGRRPIERCSTPVRVATGSPSCPGARRPGHLRERLAWLRGAQGEPWPDMSDEALLAGLDDWLGPFLLWARQRCRPSRGDVLKNRAPVTRTFRFQREICRGLPRPATRADLATRRRSAIARTTSCSRRGVQELFGFAPSSDDRRWQGAAADRIAVGPHTADQTTRDLPRILGGIVG